MRELKATERVEPQSAEEMLVHLEDQVLTPDQLMYVDQLVIAREAERDANPGKGSESGSGGGMILSQVL